MRSVPLDRLVRHCDQLLDLHAFTDYDGAVNGLQVENSGTFHRIAAAVDATRATVRLAARARADLLLVHHGLFWSPTHPWTGPRYDLLRLLLDHDVAVYSAHLPLDAHPRLGNNVLLARALGLRRLQPFFEEKGRPIGYCGVRPIDRDALGRELATVLEAEPRLLPGGPRQCRRIGVVTGGAGSQLARAAAEGIDTFVTGEGPHWTYAMAEDHGVNVFYGGHYATETFGVKALAAHLSDRFSVPWVFLDHPTGL